MITLSKFYKIFIGEKTSGIISEDLFFTHEKNNLTSENNFTDVLVLYNVNGKISVIIGFDYFQFLKQSRSTDLFSNSLTANYHPNERFNLNVLLFKPICSGWKDMSKDFYTSIIADYKTSSNKELLLRLWTDYRNDCKTRVSVGISFPLKRLIAEINTIPNHTGLYPGSLQLCIKYPF